MRGLFLVEPVVALYAFSAFLTFPLLQQYIYRRIWEQVTNTSYPISGNTSRCDTNSSSNHSHFSEEVQRQASLFSLYSEVFTAVPSMIVTIMLVAYSDRGGRKITIILPLIGTTLFTLSFLMVSYFRLNIYLLIVFSVINSLFGGIGTFMGGCFAYVADLCEDDRQKTLRLAGVDMMIGLLSGVGSVLTGPFLKHAGFNWPLVTSVLCQCVVLLYATFILEETVKKVPADAVNLDGSPKSSALKQMIFGIYQMFRRADKRSRTRLLLLLLIISSFFFAFFGGTSTLTLFELSEPLCWDEVLIGYGAGLSATVFLTSFLGISAFTYCGVPQLIIIMIGILSVTSAMIVLAFTKTTLMVFIARVLVLLAVMPFPMLRSMMSSIISKSEQGALFACVSFLENLTSNISNAIFNSVYSATVAWYPGFVFALSAGLCAVPLFALGVVGLIGVDVAQQEEITEPVISGEEEAVRNEKDSSPLFS
ncbi:lysosomal proton-coupled steroid conjugate and bile acid symporter SLC46A3 [Antennarius striatus]|uniref:lysosomal proton-coupled steroid conjugate and bile acid symporter SLC46A3 n=1 Tax=Antennarius striatus TaxID=241820 RepID=UPI0035B2113C